MILIIACISIWSDMLIWGHLLRFALLAKANESRKKKKKQEEEEENEELIVLSCTQDVQKSSNKTKRQKKPKFPKKNAKAGNLQFLKNKNQENPNSKGRNKNPDFFKRHPKL